MKVLIVCKSEHHGNTQKIAEAMAEVINGEVVEPKDVDKEQVLEMDLIGFGSGIYYGKHHERLLDLAGNLPKVKGKKHLFFPPAVWGSSRYSTNLTKLLERS